MMTTHDEPESVAADHEHSRATVTATLLVPPSALNDRATASKLGWHLESTDAGAVTLVFVELPHAASTEATAATADCKKMRRTRVTSESVMQLSRQLRCNSFRCSYNQSSPLYPMFCNFSRLRVVRVPFIALVAWAALATTSGCTAHEHLIRRHTGEAPGLSWFGPTAGAEQASLARWATAVGPPLIVDHGTAQHDSAPSSAAAVTLATWNVAVGEGDVAAFVADLRRDHPERPIVVLLQEAYRESPDVPSVLQNGSVCAGHLGKDHGGHGQDIGDVAAESGLNVYYVPSMRNGAPHDSHEDRGNAILSSLPLDDLGAIELPFERQRRVAVAATVTGRSPNGAPWHMRMVSAHLDNMVGARRLWFAGGTFARARQARALVDYVQDDEIAVLGGDFNTWFGFAEPAFQHTARAFPDTDVKDTRPTFHHLLRLDHLFFRLPDGWTASFERGRSQYGSDHWPLVATVQIGS